jgi:Cu/Ag efflux protein CusF
MRQLTATILATAIFVPAIATAQIKTLPGETITVTATIEAIDRTTRSLTLKRQDGKLETITVPEDVKRFSELKVGDTITARYYENIVLRVKAPGEPAVDTASESLAPRAGQRPGATAGAQRVLTVTITAIDPAVPSITVTGPNNWTYSYRVADKAALKQVKVGDRLDITWTAAVLVSADATKPK